VPVEAEVHDGLFQTRKTCYAFLKSTVRKGED